MVVVVVVAIVEVICRVSDGSEPGERAGSGKDRDREGGREMIRAAAAVRYPAPISRSPFPFPFHSIGCCGARGTPTILAPIIWSRVQLTAAYVAT
ncbi:hypothetical protein BZA05DRAFT_207328 [Tricharina praecox]|uniref:uncharacterized protein n=1 Tax=Tricharina praecox TaxID=43433 RepID=UPI00221EBDBC|nr:uncharacterized protein BZA05DRAFT_207328 [Tricharina praecox]KAI5842075.1 hypothetical protein BZA05DRAFT_207328 [Tricharina praecox]